MGPARLTLPTGAATAFRFMCEGPRRRAKEKPVGAWGAHPLKSPRRLSMNDEQLQSVYVWVDSIPLSRPKRNISRDFSDGGK